jgi:NitT/TauT family transport system substrate-binding protein
MGNRGMTTQPLTRLTLDSRAIICLLLVACIQLTSCSPATNAPALRDVTIAQAGDFFLYAPLYIAVDAGFFKRNGLNVSLISTGGDDKTWAAVLSGGASFGVADPTFVAIAGARGEPGRVIASVVNGVPFWGITYNHAIPVIRQPRDLDSYTVATFPAPSTAYILQREMFLRAGLAPKIRQGAFGTLQAMLKARQADIALELEPNVSQASLGGARVLYSMATLYGDFAITGLTTSPRILQNDPALAREVVCGLQQALVYARNHPDGTLTILSKRFPELAPSVAHAAFRRVSDAGIIPRTVLTSPIAWRKAIDLRVRSGDLAQPANPNVYLDNSFAQWAETHCSLAASPGVAPSQ